MDYIREELLRQRIAWERLLLGRSAEQEEQDTAEETAQMMDAELFCGSRALAAAEQLSAARGEPRGAEREDRERSAMLWEELPLTVLRWEMERAQLRDRMQLPAARIGQDGRSASVFSEEAAAESIGAAGRGPEEFSTVEWAAGYPARRSARTAESAQTLSLAVQRDARRYDGGFSLY